MPGLGKKLHQVGVADAFNTVGFFRLGPVGGQCLRAEAAEHMRVERFGRQLQGPNVVF